MSFSETNRVCNTLGDAVLFRGDVIHVGIRNTSKRDRIFMYAIIQTGIDHNDE